MIAEPVPVRIVRNPISTAQLCFDCPLQSSKGPLVLANERENTARVVENRVVIRRERHRVLVPLLSPLDFPKPC
jgi:hypothetical protein